MSGAPSQAKLFRHFNLKYTLYFYAKRMQRYTKLNYI